MIGELKGLDPTGRSPTKSIRPSPPILPPPTLLIFDKRHPNDSGSSNGVRTLFHVFASTSDLTSCQRNPRPDSTRWS